MDFGVTIISALIAAVISVVGWFVIDWQGRRTRREEMQRDVYQRLFDLTLNLSTQLMTLSTNTNKSVGELKQLFAKSSSCANDGREVVNDWSRIMTKMLDEIYSGSVFIMNYLKFLEMSGANTGCDTMTYQALKSVSVDTSRALYSITDKWISYVNFSNMNDIQLESLEKRTKSDLEYVNEFCNCLDDVLTILYNNYMARPYGLKIREVDFTLNRRYVTEDGLVDKRAG